MPSYQRTPKVGSRLRATRTVFSLTDGNYPNTAPPGTYEIHDGWLILACPQCGDVSAIRVGAPDVPDRETWEMSGDLNAPTLTQPLCWSSCCGWTGTLKAGWFTCAKPGHPVRAKN